MNRYGLMWCSLLACLAACSDPLRLQPDDPGAAQQAYFPLETGKYLEYVADSMQYDFQDNGDVRIDSSRTLVRLQILDTFVDAAGETVFRIERFERPDENTPWTFRRMESAWRNTTQAVYTENNLRFLKLVFPMDRRTSWDGNHWIDPLREINIAGETMRPFSHWDYGVDSLDIPGKIGTFSFDSLLIVTEADENNLVERRYSKAIYAKHLGLVQRIQWILDSQYCNQNPIPADCFSKPWEQKAQKGFILKMTLLQHN
jgi:hypothetical protein